jgi:hypothetical protein
MKRSLVFVAPLIGVLCSATAQQYHWNAGDNLNYQIHTILQKDSVKNAEDWYIVHSPDGTWLLIRFGEDWQGIVKKYIALYH